MYNSVLLWGERAEHWPREQAVDGERKYLEKGKFVGERIVLYFSISKKKDETGKLPGVLFGNSLRERVVLASGFCFCN